MKRMRVEIDGRMNIVITGNSWIGELYILLHNKLMNILEKLKRRAFVTNTYTLIYVEREIDE